MDTVKFSLYLPDDYNNNEIEEMLLNIKEDFQKNNIKILDYNFEKGSLIASFTLFFINNPEIIIGSSVSLTLMLWVLEKYFGKWIESFSGIHFNKLFKQNKSLVENIHEVKAIVPKNQMPEFFDILPIPPIKLDGTYKITCTGIGHDYIYTYEYIRDIDNRLEGFSFFKKEK